MKIYKSIQEFNALPNAVVTTGTFDGVHIGHRKIIEQLTRTAREHSGESVILTFSPHPRMVLYPDERTLRLLNTAAEKISLLAEAGVEHLIIHPFSKEFSEMSYQQYISEILVRDIGAKMASGGGNTHHFGHAREGGFKQLLALAPALGFNVEEIPEQDVKNVAVSSTKIRQALEQGDVTDATAFLGYHYTLTGRVVEGNKIGRTLGYPTANVVPAEWYKLIPADGVYAVLVSIGNIHYKGMLGIGVRPTVGKDLQRTIEVNIFNFDKEIYGEEITLHFVQYLRPEEKFADLNAMMHQLHEDKQNSTGILARF